MLVARVIGYSGRIVFDPSRPDGTPRKLLDAVTHSHPRWHAQIPLERGIASTYEWYQKVRFTSCVHMGNARLRWVAVVDLPSIKAKQVRDSATL